MKKLSYQNDNMQKQNADLDSLLKVVKQIEDRSQIGWHYIYTPSKNYVMLDSLLSDKIKPNEIQHLAIVNWKRHALPKQIFSCTHLESLEIIDSKINKIPRRLNKLKLLTQLAIYNNIPNGKLKLRRNNTIKQLTIHSDYPDKLPGSYRNFELLDTLDLRKNRLVKFPAIRDNKHLVKVVLSDNRLTLEDLQQVRNGTIEVFVLGNNKITKVPDAIKNFPALKKLNFQLNQITEVSEQLSSLRNLEEISFYKNDLKSIPKSIYKLHNLKLIDLYYNKIDSVNDDIGLLKKLELLYLAHNRISYVSPALGNLTNLKELYLHHNLIVSLPESIECLEDLTVLRINDNLFPSLSENILHLHDLSNLDISRNYLSSIPVEICTLHKLHILSMNDNPWTSLEQPYNIAEKLRAAGTIVHLNITKTTTTSEEE